MIVADGESKRFVYANGAASDLLRYTPEELTHLSVHDIHPPEYLDAVLERFEAHRRNERTVTFGVPCLRKDGAIAYADISAGTHHLAGRECTVGVFRNAFERMRAERGLRQSEALLRSTIDSMQDAVHVVDEDLSLLLVSDVLVRWAAEFGVNMEEAIGRPLRVACPFLSPAIEDEYREVFRSGRMLATKDVTTFHGRRICVETRKIPVLEDGVVRRVVTVLRDTTAGVEAERQLRESEARLRSFFEHVPVMLHSIDADGRLLNVSGHWLATMGYAREEVLGRKSTDFLSPESRERAERLTLPRFFQTGCCTDVPYRMVRKDGATVDVLLSAVTERDAVGSFQRSLAVSVDVTERNRLAEERRALEARVRHAEELQSLTLLAAGIAHDFKSILVGAAGNAVFALRNLPEGHAAREYVERVEEAVTRAWELAERMVSSMGEGELAIQPLALVPLVRSAVTLLGGPAAPSVRVSLDLDEPVPVVEADAVQLRRVLNNLLQNALEAVDRNDGQVRVTVGPRDVTLETLAELGVADDLRPGCYVCVSVSDNGSGMSEEARNRVFEPFFTTKGAGRGLGLAAALSILRAHRGSVGLVSVPERGTTFTLLLPPAGGASGPEPASLDGV